MGPRDHLVEQKEFYPRKPTAYEGNYAMEMHGVPGLQKKLRQVILVRGRARTPLRLEGFARAFEPGGPHRATVEVVYYDGTSDAFAIRFPTETEEWQRQITRFSARQPFRRLIVSVLPGPGRVRFDALHLWRAHERR